MATVVAREYSSFNSVATQSPFKLIKTLVFPIGNINANPPEFILKLTIRKY